MRISTTIFLTDETVTPVRLARELEQRGFGGLYLPEHTHSGDPQHAVPDGR